MPAGMTTTIPAPSQPAPLGKPDIDLDEEENPRHLPRATGMLGEVSKSPVVQSILQDLEDDQARPGVSGCSPHWADTYQTECGGAYGV